MSGLRRIAWAATPPARRPVPPCAGCGSARPAAPRAAARRCAGRGGTPGGHQMLRWPVRCVRTTGAAPSLLQMADVYVACLCPRCGRGDLLSQRGARELDLGPSRQPDPLGALFVKPAGFYLPGSCVRPANDEVAAVTRRVPKADPPRIFAMVSRQGTPWASPPCAIRRTPPLRSGQASPRGTCVWW